MNHYPFHIGDYTRATAHLTPLEDCFYRRALDWYYSNEKPLPSELKKVCRLLRASGKDGIASVQVVLDEFFYQADDGWRHKRCDREIVAFNESAQEREERDANEAERKRRYRERRKTIFEELREYDIVPKWDTSLEQLQTMLNDAKSRNKDAPRTRTGAGQVEDTDATGTANQNQNQNQNQFNNTYSSKREDIFQEPIDDRPKFKMFFGWQVPPNFLTARKAYGFNPDLFSEQVLTEFCGYWAGKNEKLTQGEWEHKLASNLVKLTRNPALSTGAARKGNTPDNNTTDWMSDELLGMLNAESN